MADEIQSARDDLAFLRNIVETGESTPRGFGEAYFAAGLIYGAQMLMHGAQAYGYLPGDGLAALLIGLGPTVLFIPVMIWIVRRHRTGQPTGMAGRTMAMAFSAVGLSNLVFVAVIGSVAWREHSITTWLIYPCAVFILQGAAWLVTYMLRRRFWHGLVALGWFVAAIGMAQSVTDIPAFLLWTGAGIWLCMTLPGWAILRGSR